MILTPALFALQQSASGGADSISILPHTITHGLPDAFARRVARNTQLVMAGESHVDFVADPAKVPSGSGCDSPLAFVESYCLTEPEGGISSAPAAAPYDRCPAAIEPPKAAAFSVPQAALLDWKSTGSRRSQGRPECCYAWCSNAPPGSGLERRR